MSSFKYIFFPVLVFTFVVFIFSKVISFFLGGNSGSRQLKRDVRMLRSQLSDFKESLIPFDMEDYKIVSSNPIVKKKRRGKATILKGFLSTIYQEPIMAFALKDKLQNKQFTLITESDKDEYIFNYTLKGTHVKHNGGELGVIDSEGHLIDLHGNILGELEIKPEHRYQKILIKNKEVAYMNVHEEDKGMESDRMFSLFHDFSISDEKEMIALSIYNLLIRPRL